MFDFLKPNGSHLIEHQNWPKGVDVSTELLILPNDIIFLKDINRKCIEFKTNGEQRILHNSYYIGIDWLTPNKAIYVQPKLNKGGKQTNYLQMLFNALKHPEVSKYSNNLFEIKFDEPQIEIEQEQDLLTPLLVLQFLIVVKKIVRKGLKKSYYKVDRNLYGRVKGKILVGQTIKQNLFKNKTLNTYCSYDEFGWNGLENRLLKKALVFVQRFLQSLQIPGSIEYTTEVFNYIMPAFESVSPEINLNEVKHTKGNVFYKEYEEAIRLAKFILKRFGYNITKVEKKGKIETPPFWIDMSKLFELYVLGLLKDRFGSDIKYQPEGNYGKPDYILIKEGLKFVIDAKYRPLYNSSYDPDDIRQISQYARDKAILKQLNINEENWPTTVPDCLIIYPNQDCTIKSLMDVSDLKASPIPQFVNFYKTSIRLPEI